MPTRPNLLDPRVRANPYPLYACLRRERPVCEIEPGGLWAVSRYDDVVYALRHPELFSSSGFRVFLTPPWLDHNPAAESLVMCDPPDHTRLRAFVSRAFSPRTLAPIEARIRTVASELADRVVARGEVDVVDEFAGALPTRIIAEVLGLDPALGVHFKRWVNDQAVISPAITDPVRIAEIKTSIHELVSYLDEAIEARRRAPSDDLVGELMRPDASGQLLTEDELRSFLVVLLVAGLETSTALLSSTLRLLAERPADLQHLRQDPAFIPAYLEEVLRYEPPAHGLARLTTQEVELGGTRLAAGSVVLVLLGSANRDENYFPEPDRFDPGRSNQKAVAFGYGIHSCVGAVLARMEGRIGLKALLERVAHIAPVPGEIRWNESLVSRCPIALPLRFESAST
ncbi:MAG TPA: cytochrome P450 [Polyangia bacterium]|nr:cytochrome P450 [Polyangia bacterium]